MSASDLGPLDWRMGIVDKAGRPTPEFQRKWEAQRLNNTLIGTTLGSGAPPVSPVPEDGKEYVDTSTTPWTLYVAQGGTWTKVGVYKFTDLTDAPHDYTTNANKLLQVKATEDGLQFGTLTSVLDSIGSVRGDILYRGPTSWTVLAPGTSGQVLKTGGAGADPSWGTAGVTPGGTTGQLQYNNGGTLGGVTVGGDGTLNTTTGSLIVTKTNGVSFAPSATTDTTNASNISSGTLAAARGGAGTVNGILQANGSGAVSAVTIGSGLSYSSGVLTATGSSGLANPSTLGTVTFQQITGVPSNSLPMGSLSLRSDLPRAYLSQTPSTAVPSRVQEVSACGTYTATLPGTPTTGNFLVAMCGHGSVQPVANTGWTEISHHSQTSLEGYVTLLYKQVGASEPAIQTPCSGTPGAQGSVGIVEVSGIGTWSSSFQSGVYGLGGATISGTTPLANCLLLTFASWWGTGAVPSMSQGSAGWTHQVSTNTGGASIQMTASQPTTTAGTAYSSSMTTSAWSNQMTESVVVLAPSTGGGIGPVPLSILTTLKSSGSTVTSYAQSINFGTGLTATDDGQGNTTVNATGGGGGSTYIGSMVPIKEVVTSGSQASVTISGIPQTYRDLLVVIRGRGTAASTAVTPQLQFNGDTGLNYDVQYLEGTPTAGGGNVFAGGSFGWSRLAGASAPANYAGGVEATIFNYAGTTFNKVISGSGGAIFGTSGSTTLTGQYTGQWRSTAAVNQITVTLNTGAFVDGSVVTVYGLGGTAGAMGPSIAVGSMVPIAEVITTGSQPNAVLTIPSGYRDIKIVVTGRSTLATGSLDDLLFQFNGDTGSNYSDIYWQSLNSTSVSTYDILSTRLKLGWLTNANAPANMPATTEVNIRDYASTTFNKTAISNTNLMVANSANNIYDGVFSGWWNNTAAITSVKVYPGSGNFVDGTKITVYGIGGTGGAVSLIVSPDNPPLSAGSLDDEFNIGTSIDTTRWTWTNQGTATAPIDHGWLTLTAPSTGTGDNWHLLTQGTPGTPWSVAAKFLPNSTTNSNFTYGGLVLRESSTGKFIAFSADNSNGLIVGWWNSPTSFNATKTSVAWGIWPMAHKGIPYYYKVQDDGTNLKFSVSFTGADNSYIQVWSESRTAFLTGGPNQVGLGAGTNIASGTMLLGVDYFRRTQ